MLLFSLESLSSKVVIGILGEGAKGTPLGRIFFFNLCNTLFHFNNRKQKKEFNERRTGTDQ
ncbi:hypothetical protein V7654_12755 [Bacillus sp. JJ1609]|uniref:hypothetical protein n=1 Tax=Bacillus sp. JJ1609 TaxID=3122977 RepID=UPI0030007C9B